MRHIYAIGDIHGCYDKLLALLDKVDMDLAKDTLVFMGDYIDRGTNSYEVVEFLIDFRKKHRNVVFLKGNHEEMLDNFLFGPDKMTYLQNGGQQTLESYMKRASDPDRPPIPQNHLDFFRSLDLYHETDQHIFVHAGMKDKVPLEKQDAEDLLWIRGRFVESTYDFGRRVVFGHTPFMEPLVEPNKIGIDTGAVYGNVLTCVKLPEIEFFSA